MSFLQAIPFGLIGLGLAVLDFTGASRKLEAVLRRYVEYERRYALETKKLIFTTDLDFHKQKLKRTLPVTALAVLVIAIAWAMMGESNQALWIEKWLPEWPIWSILLWAPALFLIWYVVSHLVGEFLGYATSVVLWFPLWLLSLPKAGILGTIGLIVAAADNFLK